MTAPVTLTITLSAEAAERLQTLAQAQNRPLEALVEEVMETYLDDEDEDEDEWEETPDEEILRGLRASLEDVKAGRLLDADDALATLRKNMAVKVKFPADFNHQLDRLGEKYPSVFDDVEALQKQLEQGLTVGDRIPGVGHRVYKARLPNRSANKGKSGGFRVIDYVQTQKAVVLLSIYVKTEKQDIATREIIALLKEFLVDDSEQTDQ